MLVGENMYHQIVEDNKLWRKDLLVMYLYDCLINDTDIIIDFCLEGSCCRTNGLYRILDTFCSKTYYDPARITIKTANVIEHHNVYQIEVVPEYWYEVNEIQIWLKDHPLITTNTPQYHFGNFIGRATWYRIWIASLLNSRYCRISLQTFNSSIRSCYIVKDEGTYDYLGLEELIVKYKCNILPEVIEFLKSCPRTIKEDLEYIKTVIPYIPQVEYYPIQHPANLNILKEYPDIFVDIVCETRVLGDIFFVTEKTWRCILARRPFIIVGSQHFLQNLKKLGFCTFNEYWDEGYDEYPIGQRIQEIEKLLETISKWPVEKLHLKLEEMQELLDHNYNTFINLTYDKIEKIFQ